MPHGFVGAAAKRFLSRADDILNDAINVHTSNAHGASITNASLPYTPDDALTGSATGGGGSENLVADTDMTAQAMRYMSDANQANGTAIHEAITYVEQICETDFVLPVATPKVIGTAQQIMSALNTDNNIRHEFMALVNSYARNMTDDPVGKNIDMAWNTSVAIGIRNELEKALREQEPFMRNTIRRHEHEITRMEGAIPGLRDRSENAMTTVTRSTRRRDADGNMYTHFWDEEIPDIPGRESARAQMNHYLSHIPVLRSAITSIRSGIETLDRAIPDLRRFFADTHNELQQIDRQFAERIRQNIGEMHANQRRVRLLIDNITTNFIQSAGGMSSNRVFGTDYQLNNVNDLFKYDEDGNLIFDWEEIARLLDKPYDDITNEEFWALVVAMVMAGSDGLESLERFIRYMPDKVDSDWEGFIDVWEMCPRKVNAMYDALEVFLSNEYPGYATIMQYRALLFSLRDIAPPKRSLDADEALALLEGALLGTAENARFTRFRGRLETSRNLLLSYSGQRPIISLSTDTTRFGENSPVMSVQVSITNTRERWDIRDTMRMDEVNPNWRRFSPSRHVDHRTWWIPPGLSNSDDMNRYLLVQQNLFNQQAFGQTSGIPFLNIIGTNIRDGLIGGILSYAPSPYGELTGVGIGIILDTRSERAALNEANNEATRLFNTAGSILDGQALRTLSDDFSFDMSLILHDNGTTISRVYPTAETERRIAALNDSGLIPRLALTPPESTSGGIFNRLRPALPKSLNTVFGPFTFDTIINNPYYFWFHWGDLDPGERYDILKGNVGRHTKGS